MASAPKEEPKKKKGGIKVGQYVWVKDAAIAGTDLFTKGHVLSIDEKGKVTLETSNGIKTQELILPLAECHQPHPGDDVPDHCQLMFLSQPTLLENTRVRYMADKIYTLVGEILVAVNPFRWIPSIYGQDIMMQCKGKKLWNCGCGPHVYGISEKAYAAMKKSRTNQCIVVSGESGAGKTETNRQLMNYLVWRGTDSQSEDTLTQKILDTNPILEAFGNAKTTRNNNSSRFGRYVLVRFSEGNEVVGAQVRTFLLERSRVTSTSKANERSYHIFYMLVSGKTPHAPEAVEKYRYLSMSGCTTVPTWDDVEEFKVTNKSLLSVGVPQADLDTCWACVGAMLYIGNIDFGSGDGKAVIADTSASSPVRIAEKLLCVEDMSILLCQRQITVNGEVTFAEHTPANAATARDALVKIMYARLFSYLVLRINETVDDASKAKLYIGLLDVYGFEFFEVNSFEQLCINFANEKLQQFFLKTVFDAEEQAYKEEGVPWISIAYADNGDIIDLCENNTKGIYKLLDSECRAPNTSGKTFCATLHGTFGAKHPVFGAPKMSKKEQRSKDEYFLVRHFAGDVIYFADEFLAKNNDSLAAEVEAHLLKSSKPIIADICKPDAPPPAAAGKGPKKGGGSSFASVGDKFVKSLRALMEELQSSTAHFVRCIKSNPELKPLKMHGESVINQLRLSGTLDAVKLIQAGYPTRIPYELIHSRYKNILADAPGLNISALTPAEFCEAIAEACGVGKHEYSLGVSRMFFKMGAAVFLEELAEADPEEMKPKLMEMFALFEQKRKAKPMVEKTVLMWLFKRRYEVVVKEKREKETEELRKAEERFRKAEEERKRKEEEERRRKEQEERRRQEEERRKKEEEERAKVAEAAAIAAAEEEARKAAELAEIAAEKAAKEAAEKAAKEEGISVAQSQANVAKAVEEAKAVAKKEAVSKVAEVREGAAKALEAKKAAKQSEAEEAAKTLSDVEAMINALENDADLEQAVEAAGGVKSLIEMAAKHEDSALVQAQFAGVLRDLCISDDIAIEIANAGGTDALIEAARIHYDSIEVQAAVAGALRNLSELDQIAVDIATAGGIEVLIDACARHPDSPIVAARVAGALWGLSVHDDIAELIGEMGGTDSLILAAKNHPMNEEVQASTAGAMRNLSVSDDNKHSIADMEGLEVLIAASENHLDNALVQAQVAGALRNLSLNDEVAEQIAVSGGIEALVSASSSHADNSKVQAGVAGALRNLSVNDEIAEEIATAGGIDALILASENHPTNSDVQAEVAGALWGLSVNDEIEEAIAAANGIAILVVAAKNHFNNAKVQARVAGALRKLSANDENKHEIASSGGIEMLIKSSEIHLENAVVQAGVAGALSNLSVDDEIEQLIASHGGIEVLINAAKAHINNVKVQARVVRALTNLSVHEENKARIASTLGIVTLIESSFEHMESAEVQAGVAGALRNLSVSPQIAQLIVEKNAIQSLVQAAQVHTTNAIVQAGVAGALRNLSVNEHNRKAIIQCGGVAALDLAAQLHADNEKLQIEVAGARRNLLGDPVAEKKAEEPPKGNTTGRGQASPRSRSPLRRPSFGRKSSRKAIEPKDGEAPAAGSETERRKMSFLPSFGGLSRRNKSPAPGKTE